MVQITRLSPIFYSILKVKSSAIDILNSSVNMSLKKACKISSDCFCYVCGYYINSRQMKRKIIPETKFFKAFEAYFGMKMDDQDKS